MAVAMTEMVSRASGAALGLLVVAGMLVAERPLDARAIGGLNTVTVSPAHGKAAVPFQVTYAISPCTSAAGLTIAFSWTALPPAGQLLGTATTDSTCRATLSTTPPVNAATHQPPGSYPVFGYVALPTGTPTPGTEASASYTVDVTPLPTPTARPSATASSSGAASPSASAPAASDEPGTAATAGAGKPAVSGSSTGPGWWTLPWPLVVAASLLALAVLAFLLLWLLGRRRARAAAGVGNDKAA